MPVEPMDDSQITKPVLNDELVLQLDFLLSINIDVIIAVVQDTCNVKNIFQKQDSMVNLGYLQWDPFVWPKSDYMVGLARKLGQTTRIRK